MEHMPSPLKTLTPLVTTAAIALSLGLLASAGTASAAPMQAGSGLASPGLQVEDAGYRRYNRRYQPYFGPDYYVSDAYVPSYRVYRDIPGGNNEIRELQRLFPETNWPRSLRY
jgi:hypothetical protein